jgi:outer membrane lipoprotein-sorting protein
MNKIIALWVSLLSVGISTAQPKVIDRAIVKAKTEITFPDNFGNSTTITNDNGGGSFTMPRDMETTSTMFYTPDFMKIESLSDFGNNIVITDRKNKKTTTLIEAMGRKTGFFSTDAEAEDQKARMDSIRNLRKDSLATLGITFSDNKPELVYVDEVKKISGVECKKVIIKSRGQNGAITENTIWYDPQFKLATGSTASSASGGFGGGRGMMSMGGGIAGLDQIEGFPMEYEMVRGNGFKLHMTVLSVKVDATIEDKVFEIPKGFEIKPMGSMPGREGLRVMFRNDNQ